MTPEEKAIELVLKFDGVETSHGTHTMWEDMAKKCALIAVDELIKVVPYVNHRQRNGIDEVRSEGCQFISYWDEVKDEIKKL